MPWRRPKLDGVDFKNISMKQNHMLVMNFEEEVKMTIWDCASLKSLSSDRFNFKFIKASWEIMKKDIMEFVVEFYNHGTFP